LALAHDTATNSLAGLMALKGLGEATVAQVPGTVTAGDECTWAARPPGPATGAAPILGVVDPSVAPAVLAPSEAMPTSSPPAVAATPTALRTTRMATSS
jgi:hypothetical protein